jgi:hypothetical protein
MSKFAVLISAGTPASYDRKVGWDGLHDTRAEAEVTAARAERNDGWSAKVITVSGRDADHWNETPVQRLDRERAEFNDALRNGTLYR